MAHMEKTMNHCALCGQLIGPHENWSCGRVSLVLTKSRSLAAGDQITVVLPRIPYGLDHDGSCNDCGTPPGGYHHDNCDVETCPWCRAQLLSCGCLTDSKMRQRHETANEI